jgi:hypothetical protein
MEMEFCSHRSLGVRLCVQRICKNVKMGRVSILLIKFQQNLFLIEAVGSRNLMGLLVNLQVKADGREKQINENNCQKSKKDF